MWAFFLTCPTFKPTFPDYFNWLTFLFLIPPPHPKGVSLPSITPLTTSCDSPGLGCPGRKNKHICMVNTAFQLLIQITWETFRFNLDSPCFTLLLYSLSHLLVYWIWNKEKQHQFSTFYLWSVWCTSNLSNVRRSHMEWQVTHYPASPALLGPDEFIDPVSRTLSWFWALLVQTATGLSLMMWNRWKRHVKVRKKYGYLWLLCLTSF